MKKHIVIFHTDQQRYDSLHCNGNKYAKTPNLDLLASEGSRFTRHIAANPVCMPSRASLFTGQYVPGHGVSSNGIPLWNRDNGVKDKNDYISERLFGIAVPKKVPTLAEMLLEQGYKTASFGKLHFEPHLADDNYGFYETYAKWEKEDTELIDKPYYGFTTYKLILGHGEAPCSYDHGHYGRYMHREHPEIIEKLKMAKNQGGVYASVIPSELHNTTWIAEQACDYLDSNVVEEQPIFMFLGFPDPHAAITPPSDIVADFEDLPLPEFAQLEQIKGAKAVECFKDYKSRCNTTREKAEKAYRYTQASVYLIDKAVGRVVDKLKSLGIYDDTTIIFTSDHGDFMGDFNMMGKADVAYKNLIHLPFILKPPKGLELPTVVDVPMSNADVVPTLLALNDITIPDCVQGVDIRTAQNNMPMTTCYTVSGVHRNLSIFDKVYRYTYYVNSGEEELYNHQDDPFEYENLIATQPEKYRNLCDELKSKLFIKHLECDTGLYNHYSLW